MPLPLCPWLGDHHAEYAQIVIIHQAGVNLLNFGASSESTKRLGIQIINAVLVDAQLILNRVRMRFVYIHGIHSIAAL
jgi:hypothetical protein